MSFKAKLYNLLRRSEKYTKTDMLYLAKGGSWLTGGEILNSATIFLLAIAFANLLPQETYGAYKYVLSLAGLFGIATLRGMSGAITQAAARNYEGVLVPAIKTRIRWGMFAALASIGTAGYYYLNGDNTLALSFLLIAAFLPLMESFMTYDSFLQGKKLFGVSVVYGAISQIAAVALMIATLFLTKNLLVILFVYFASWTIIRFVCLRLTLRKFKPNKEYDPKVISYGKHSSVVNITASIIGSLDSIIIFHFLGAAELAIYSFALLPVIQLRAFSNRFSTLAMPKLAQRPLIQIKTVLWKRMGFLFLLGLGASLAYIIIAPPIFKIFFPKYLDSIFLSQVFSFSLALTLGQSIFGATISSRLTMIPKKFLYLSNIPSIVLTFSMFLLIQPFGSLGIIFARMISLVSITGVSFIIWRKISNLEDHKIATSHN